METFHSLGLSEPILKAITETGYETPTPIQLQGIPPVLAGGDVLGIAQTGTGKTAAFALPILHRLAADRKPTPKRGVRALILSPTRELASQIADSFRTYGKHLGFSVAVVFGGVSERPQAEKLNRGLDILVATPGRLLDHMSQKNVSLKETEIFVLDEADQMLDLGFFKPIRRVVADLPKKRQNLFFSATMPREIEDLTRELLTNPTKIQVAPGSTTVERVTQSVIRIEQSKKKALLAELLSDEAMQRTLVFTRTKRGADRVAKHLLGAKVQAAAIHGNKSQNQREAALHSFKTGHTRVLVATDIAARGIDIDEVTHVVNFELPEVPEAYVHRIGRTARAGASGAAISFCDEGERHLLRDIERVTRQTIDSVDRRNDNGLTADKPAGKGPTGEPRDGERPAEARREFKKFGDRGRGGGRGGERRERPERSERSDRPARAERPAGERTARPARPEGDRKPWQSRESTGAPRRFERPAGDRPHRDGPRSDRSERGDSVWTSDGSRPNREHRSPEQRGERREGSDHPREGTGPREGGRPPFRANDRSDARPSGDRPRGDGPRRDGPRADRPQGDRPHQARSDRPRPEGDRPREPRREGRPFEARSDRPRPDGERREGKPRPPRDGERSESRAPRTDGPPREAQREGRKFDGPRPTGGRRDDNRGERRGENRGESRAPGGFNRDKPRYEGRSDSRPASAGERRGGDAAMKRAAGPPREGGKPEFRKPRADGPFRAREDKRAPRRDADNA